MKIDFKSLLEWDENKNQSNQKKHGISFAMASFLVNPGIKPDHKKDYGEPRFVVIGLIVDKII